MRGPTGRTRIDRIAAHKQIGIVVQDEGRTLYTHAHRVKRATGIQREAPDVDGVVRTPRPGNQDRARQRSSQRNRSHASLRVIYGSRAGVIRRSPPAHVSADRCRSRDEPRHTRAFDRRGCPTASTGRVMANTGYFEHDWFAPGWKADFPEDEVALPSALTFEGNARRGQSHTQPRTTRGPGDHAELESLGSRSRRSVRGPDRCRPTAPSSQRPNQVLSRHWSVT